LVLLCIEIGTLTPKGQEGTKKRDCYLKEDSAIINRMAGFLHNGVFAMPLTDWKQ
jgi:dihydroorotate dehydrogenase